MAGLISSAVAAGRWQHGAWADQMAGPLHHSYPARLVIKSKCRGGLRLALSTMGGSER